MHYLLHIDTSGDTGTVALSDDGILLAAVTNEETRNHAAAINIMIGNLLADAKISLNELSAVVVCAGPGSYTGLRIGMATAKGLCYALDKPLILDNRLTLLAYRAYMQNMKSYTQYVSLLVAREKEYFISIYDKDFICTLQPQHIMEEQLHLIEKKTDTLIITDASDLVKNDFIINNFHIETNIKIDSAQWALYAFEQYKCNSIVNLSAAEPFYLKQVYTHK